MRPIQWGLGNHWHVLEFLEKIIPLPMSFHPILKWWQENNIFCGQPLHPLQHALQLLTDTSNKWSLVKARKQLSHKFSRTEGGPTVLQEV